VKTTVGKRRFVVGNRWREKVTLARPRSVCTSSASLVGMQPTLRTLTAVLLASTLSLTACSFSREARAERLQSKYARKMRHDRDKSMAMIAKEKNRPLRKTPQPSAPTQTVTFDTPSQSGSESMTPPSAADSATAQPTP
jgi:hypothetical protein